LNYLMLPAKDEASNLVRLLPKAASLGLLAVVCDDGSSDNTAEVAKEMGAVVLRHESNLGLAEALKTLIRYATDHLKDNDTVVFMDADNTMDPESALRLIEALRGADIAIGSRFVPGGGVSGLSPIRQWLSLGARVFFSLVTNLPVQDYTSGFRAYRVSFLKDYEAFFPSLFASQGFAAQTELLLRSALQLGAEVVEVPIHISYERKEGVSKMKVMRTVKEYLALGLSAMGWQWRGVARGLE